MIFAGIGGQIVEHVAAARSDGDEPVLWLKRQGFHVDIGIFPDLVVDEALEHQREEALQRPAAGGGGACMGGALE